MGKTLFAYILWLLLGWCGVHHFYLGRYRHGFVWFVTFGGFGVGWLRDIWCLPRYVRESNDELEPGESPNGGQQAETKSEDQQLRLTAAKAKLSYVRIAGMFVVGYIFGYLVLVTTIDVYLSRHDWFYRDLRTQACLLSFPTVAVAIGVYTVANIGRLGASKRWCVFGSVLGLLPLIDNLNSFSCLATSSLLSTMLTCSKGLVLKKPRRQRSRSKPFRTCCFIFKSTSLAVFVALHLFLLYSAANHHTEWSTTFPEEDGFLARRFFVQFGHPLKEMLRQFVLAIIVAVDNILRSAQEAYARAANWTVWAWLKDAGNKVWIFLDWWFAPFWSEFQKFWKGEQVRHGSQWHQQKNKQEQFEEPFDPHETDPYKILGVRRYATYEEIRQAYKTMAKRWHPDKQHSHYGKQRAHAIFIKIRDAFEQLEKAKRHWH